MFNCLRLLSVKGTQWVYGGVEEIGVGFQQRSVTDSKERKEDRIRTIASNFATFRSGETAIHYRCPLISWWWACEYFADERSRGCVGGRWFGLGVGELIIGDSYEPCYPQEGCQTRRAMRSDPRW